MTLKEKFINDLNKYTDFTGKQIKLSIHMPNGETETIINPAVEGKVRYIDSAYDDDLRLKANEKIFIVDYAVEDIKQPYKINWKQKLSSRKFWVTVVGFVTSLLIVFNVDSLSIEQVAGVVTAGGVLVAYILGESKTDAANIDKDGDS